MWIIGFHAGFQVLLVDYVQWNFKSYIHTYIYIYYSKGGNVIFFCFYKRWIQWIIFYWWWLSSPLSWDIFFLFWVIHIKSGPVKPWKSEVYRNTRLNTFQEICSNSNSFVYFRGAWKETSLFMRKCALSWELCSHINLLFPWANAYEADLRPSQKNRAGSLTFCLLFWILWVLHISF